MPLNSNREIQHTDPISFLMFSALFFCFWWKSSRAVKTNDNEKIVKPKTLVSNKNLVYGESVVSTESARIVANKRRISSEAIVRTISSDSDLKVSTAAIRIYLDYSKLDVNGSNEATVKSLRNSIAKVLDLPTGMVICF